ncbi:hypothetical protein NADE_001884 [Nannochloris sp. 'desiccata']|nr:hypothetical protein NADE_001884 [Chlorella desiccata (nom. nud.)]
MALLTTCALINRVGGPARLSEIGGAPYKRQLTLSIQGQLKSGTESTKKTFFQKEDSSKLPHLNVHHAVPALLGGTALAAPLIFPAPVFAAAEQAAAQVTTTLTATTPQFSHTYHMVDDHTMCMGFPELEKTARQSEGPLPLRAFVMLDGALDPIQRGVFQMKEEGELNYAAMLYLALMSGVLEVLFGPSGVLFHSVPDIGVLKFLDYLIMWQQMLLLPQWTMAVFRYFMLI